ncbi:MAG: response regulator transcription factor [Saprospiraceae bacterium]|nr:response regulator transcription factor [Saprospiraceae bacterium]
MFDLLDRLNPSLFDQTALVFLTAFGTFDYVIQALHKSAVDYLLKPVDPQQLQMAVQKAQKEVSNRNLKGRLEELKNLLAPGMGASATLEKIPITVSHGIIRYIYIKDIKYLEGEGGICYVHTISEKPFASFQNLGYYAEILEKQGGFLRTHKKYLVNTRHIEKYDPLEGSVWLTGGQNLVFSRRKGKVLLDFFSKILGR